MKFYEQNLPGVYLIEAEPFADNRGVFHRNFCPAEYEKRGLFTQIRQTNLSENYKAYTLRGFHFQHPPKQEAKILNCVKGAIYDIVVDLRPDSPTYLKWQSFELSAESRTNLYVPQGCANAWMTLKDDSWIFYYHSEFYSPGFEGGIRYNDPFFNFKWPRQPEVISEKDHKYSDFKPQQNHLEVSP
jgi:dTDP-4-dehydrorhamnose 3,5-epimerase